MSNPNGKALKIIGLIMTGAIMVSGVVASGYKISEDSKEYTDENIRYLREEQSQKMEKLGDDLNSVKQDVAVVRIILEERFGKKR